MWTNTMKTPWCVLRTLASSSSRFLPSSRICGVTTRCLHNRTRDFKVLDAAVDVTSATYRANFALNSVLADKLKSALMQATSGGDAKAVERHTVKNKKLLTSDRLALLFDNPNEVLELSPLAGLNMKYGNIPRAGVVSVIGKIHGVYCMVVANDATIKAGTMYPISVKKQIRSLEVALLNGIPCVWLVDSGGAFLPMQAEIFPDRMQGGRTFYSEAILNSMNIPQIAIVCGSCTAGAAYVPTMAQEAIIVDKIGTIFLAGPPLVRAALGEQVTPDELGGARLHCTVSGCTDYYAKTEQEAFEMGRASVAAFNFDPVVTNSSVQEPVYSSEELLGIIPANNSGHLDMHQVIARIVDGSQFHEFKAAYGKSIVTGFCLVGGYLIGIVGNNGVMTGEAALKAAHFVQLCSQRDIPLVFLQNVTLPSSDHTSSDNLQQANADGELLRNQAKLMSSVACCGVPIVTVVVGNSYGMESYMMGGRSFSPRFLFCWPNARVCITDPQQLTDTIIEDRLSYTPRDQLTDEKVNELRQELSTKHEAQSTAMYSSSQCWDDGVIQPQDTRLVLTQCLQIVSQNPKFRSVDVAKKAILRM